MSEEGQNKRLEYQRKWQAANKERVRAKFKEWRLKNKASFYAIQDRYAVTPRGFLGSRYAAMRTRIRGNKYYTGKALLEGSVFFDWAMRDETFHRLYCAWMAAGRPRTLTPTVNRIDSNVGYIIGNMEWLTWGENSREAGLRRARKPRSASSSSPTPTPPTTT